EAEAAGGRGYHHQDLTNRCSRKRPNGAPERWNAGVLRSITPAFHHSNIPWAGYVRFNRKKTGTNQRLRRPGKYRSRYGRAGGPQPGDPMQDGRDRRLPGGPARIRRPERVAPDPAFERASEEIQRPAGETDSRVSRFFGGREAR